VKARSIPAARIGRCALAEQIAFALAHPVFDPSRQIIGGHYWRHDRDTSACLTVNIGME